MFDEVNNIEESPRGHRGRAERRIEKRLENQLLGLFDCDCACASAPNYQPVADASTAAAQISTELGREQIAESKRQFDANQAVSQPVRDAQLAIMEQTKAQGDDYYNYMKSKQRPVEDALNAESMLDTSGTDFSERQAITDKINANAAQDATERGVITGGNTGIYAARKGDIEDSVGRAVADARTGQTSATNQIIRQGMRYGWSPAKIAAMTGTQGLSQASQIASAANGTRNAEIDKARGQMAEGYNMRNVTNANVVSGMANNRNMRLQDDAKGWAKKLDVAGLYRNLPGASQGAYSLANQSGTSALQSQMAPGAQLQSGMAAGSGTIMGGQQMAIGGLSNVLNAQTSYANGVNQAKSGGDGGMGGSVIGAVGGIAAAFI